MNTLHIRMLGRFSVATATTLFVLQSLPAHLLAYLALARGKPVARQRVAGTLWPEVPEERARANLSTVAWRLKSALFAQGIEHSILVSVKEHLSLNVEKCEIDIERFLHSTIDPRNLTESLATIERAVEASNLYQGDLLEDWDDEWCLADREALRRRSVGNLHALAESFERRGRLDLALEFAQRAADAQPLDESLQLVVVRLLMRAGRKASAYSHYSKFAAAVRMELGVDPDTLPLHELEAPKPNVSAQSVSPALSLPMLLRPNRLPLVGRLVEKQALTGLLDSAIIDGGMSALLIGEAGIGKSRLASWTMEEWTARGGVTGRGACIEYNEPVAYQPVFDALDGVTNLNDLASFVAQVNTKSYPTGSSLNSGQIDGDGGDGLPRDTLRLFTWLTGKLTEACRRRPLMIVIEDLQWVDSGTLDFLMYLTARARDLRLALLMTSRQQGKRDSRHKMERVARHCTAVFRLEPLAAQETSRLVSQITEAGPVSPALIAWLQRETEGNPLFLIETLRLLAQRGGLEVPTNDALNAAKRCIAIPDGVRSVVDQRLALLKPAAVRVATVASVLGRSIDDEVLAMVAGITQNTLSRHVAGLLDAGIFERDGAGYRFTHDKIREVCYQSLPTIARRARHIRAAAVLAQRPEVPPHTLAWHQACAGQWALATVSWTNAGDQSKSLYAYEQAFNEYQQAEICLQRDDSLDDPERAIKQFHLLGNCDDVLAALGRTQQQHAIQRRMESVCQKTQSVQLAATLCVRRAWLSGYEGAFISALQLGRRGWALARRDDNRELEVKALHVIAWQFNRLGRNRRALQSYELALRRDNGMLSVTRATLLSERAMALARSGNLAAAESSLAEARLVRRKMGDLEDDATSLVSEVNIRHWRASARESIAAVNGAVEFASRTGDMVLSALATSQMSRIQTLGGHLGDALRKLRAARVLARSMGLRRTLAGCLNEVANGIGRLIGNYESAAALQALRLSQTLGTPLLSAVCLDSQAMVLMELGEFDLALEKIELALAIYATNNGSLGPWQESLGRRGAIQMLRGRPDYGLRDLADAAQSQRRSGERVVLADTLSYLAMAEAKTGDLNKARGTSEEAIHVLEEIECTGYQPQRVLWHHYRILEMIGNEPRAQYLRRAVDFIDAQASTISKAQARRLRFNVPLNRAILDAWAGVQSPSTSPSASVAS